MGKRRAVCPLTVALLLVASIPVSTEAAALALSAATPQARNGHVLTEATTQPVSSNFKLSGPIAPFPADGAGGIAGTPPGTQVYRNVIGGDLIIYRPGAGQRMAEDMTLASGPCTLSYYTIRVAGINQGAGPTFDVQTELWNGDPCLPGSSVIVGTEQAFTGISNNQSIFDLEATLTTPVSVPGTVWLAATFSSNDAGWVRADQAEVGSTTNIWSENHIKITPEDLPTGCQLFTFNSSGTPWAGFWAQLNCNLPGDPLGACCDGIACSQTTETGCVVGTWQGAFTSCVPNVCLSGACCTGGTFAACSDTTQDQCTGGLFHPGGLCSQGACGPNYKVYENSFNTNIYDIINSSNGQIWGDDLKLGSGAPCNLSSYEILFAGNSATGPANFNVHTELWTNDDRLTPAFDGDDIPGVLIPGTQRDFLNVPANLFSQRLLAGPFPGIAIPKKVWIVMSTNANNAGPVTAGYASTGFSVDGFAIFNAPGLPGVWTPGFWYEGHTPEDCPGPSCQPAGSFRAQVWCEGEPPTGACCNDSAGTCTDGVREVDCNGRWREADLCANNFFDPPCGAGACCYPQFFNPPNPPTMLCVNTTEADCIDPESWNGDFKRGRFCDDNLDDALECPMYKCLYRTGDCFSAHPQVGCEDAYCCDIVCDPLSGDTFCCDTAWDETCAQSALQNCEQPLQNDNCSEPQVIANTGTFPYDNTDATTDGPLHITCATVGGDEQITKDLWFCWTAPCTTQALARTCGNSTKDTKIAVYEGCACPPTDARLLDCDDDRCEVQSMAAFDAIAGQQYLIRVGSYPGEPAGPGSLTVSCGPPNNTSCPNTGDCCEAHIPGACSDELCCETVCLCDPFCCNTEWDAGCAGDGFGGNGCGAAQLCEDVCTPPCPAGAVTFTDPPNGLVDARRPHPPNNPSILEGIQTLTVQAPAGSDRVECWQLCETDVVPGSPNSIVGVVSEGRGQFTISLARPITQGAVTTVMNLGGGSIGSFISHPANINSNSAATPADILDLIDHLNGVRIPPLNLWQCDIDRSGICAPADIINEIDLLNGTNGYRAWNGTSKPVTAGVCP